METDVIPFPNSHTRIKCNSSTSYLIQMYHVIQIYYMGYILELCSTVKYDPKGNG